MATRGLQALRLLPPSEANFNLLTTAFNTRAADEDRFRHELLIEALARQKVESFYPAATIWMQDNPNTLVRRTLVKTLAADFSEAVVPILQVALDDNDHIVRIRAAFGLVLAGGREHLDLLIEAARAKNVDIRNETITWLGIVPLLEVLNPVLESLTVSSTQVRLAGIVRAHDIGERSALLQLMKLLEDKSTKVVEQAAVMLQSLVGKDLSFRWKG